MRIFRKGFVKVPSVHAEQDFQIIRFALGKDLFDYFRSAVRGIRLAAANKSSDISLQFIAEGKLVYEICE